MIYELTSFPKKYVDLLRVAFERNECNGVFIETPCGKVTSNLLIELPDETFLVLLAMQAGNIEATKIALSAFETIKSSL